MLWQRMLVAEFPCWVISHHWCKAYEYIQENNSREEGVTLHCGLWVSSSWLHGCAASGWAHGEEHVCIATHFMMDKSQGVGGHRVIYFLGWAHVLINDATMLWINPWINPLIRSKLHQQTTSQSLISDRLGTKFWTQAFGGGFICKS